MPQSILLRRSVTAGSVPAAAEFDVHSIALNLADGLLYWRDSGGAVRSTDLLFKALAKLASPAFTGTPTAPTAALGTNTTQIATMAALAALRSDLVNGAGSSLDQLNELAAALGNDANFSTTVLTALSNRLRGDTAVGYTAAQVAQFVANLGLTDRQPCTGDLVMTLGNVAPQGCLKLNGTTLSRTTYAGLWAWVQANANLVDDGAWTGGATAAFSRGDGSTTFRIPDFRGEMLRMWDDGRAIDGGRGIGTLQGQNLPNHYHQTPIGYDSGQIYGWLDGNNYPAFGSNLLSGTTRGRVGWAAIEGNTNSRTAFTDVSAYGVSGELRPRNVSTLACIRYK